MLAPMTCQKNAQKYIFAIDFPMNGLIHLGTIWDLEDKNPPYSLFLKLSFCTKYHP